MTWSLQIDGLGAAQFSDLGLSRLKRTIRSQHAGTFSFIADGANADSNALAAEGTPCAVLRDGEPFFAGRLYQIPRKGSGSAESVEYEIRDAWYDFERNLFQQQWNIITSVDEDGNPTLGAEYRSEIILGMDLSGDSQTNGEVIAEIVSWAISVGAYCQLGDIAVSAPVPMDEVTDLPCSECIKKMLRWTPDAVAWFDYTRTPPAFNVTQRADCQAVFIPFSDAPEAIEIKALPDLLASCVVIRYLQENKINGVPYINTIVDDYPEGNDGTAYASAVMTCRLAGTDATYQQNPVTVIPIPQESSDSSAVPFVAQCTPWLRKFTAGRIIVNSVSTTLDPNQYDSQGNAVDPEVGDYPNVVISGDVAADMGVQSARVTVVANISYQYPDPMDDEANAAMKIFGPSGGALANYGNSLDLTMNVVGTDAVTKTYSRLSSYILPEPAPSCLAAYLYQTLNVLQYEGQYTTISSEAGYWVLGTVLNLAGGRPEWGAMNALLQEIEDDLDNGRTTLKFGAAGHLTVQDLMEQIRANRSRTTSSHIKERRTGQPGDTPLVNGPYNGPGMNNPPPPAPTAYPWIDFIVEQEEDSEGDDPGQAQTWDALLGYGQSSFAGSDQIDHSGPLEEFEISVGNDGSGWTASDHNANQLNNVFSMISGDDDYTKDWLWIGAMDDSGDGGSVRILPSDPNIQLSPNLNPADDTDDDQHIHISLGDYLIEIQNISGSTIDLDASGAPTIYMVDAVTGNTSTLDDNSLFLSDVPTGGAITIDASTTSGKSLSTQTVQVCVDGVQKSMLIIGSDPY